MFKSYFNIGIIIFITVLIGSIGYWIGDKSTNELRDAAKELQTSLKNALQREQQALATVDELKSKLGQSDEYINQLEANQQAINTGFDEVIARLKREQDTIRKFTN